MHSPTIIAITESSDTLRVSVCSMGDIRYTPDDDPAAAARTTATISQKQAATVAPSGGSTRDNSMWRHEHTQANTPPACLSPTSPHRKHSYTASLSSTPSHILLRAVIIFTTSTHCWQFLPPSATPQLHTRMYTHLQTGATPAACPSATATHE